jgi:hypothetical protein
MADNEATGHVRALERMGYHVTLDFTAHPWVEAAGHAWCRKCFRKPLMRGTVEGQIIIYCEGHYVLPTNTRLTGESLIFTAGHTADRRYKMRKTDNFYNCNGSPCLCEEVCPGWEVTWNQ